jgi:hypothetical protein
MALSSPINNKSRIAKISTMGRPSILAKTRSGKDGWLRRKRSTKASIYLEKVGHFQLATPPAGRYDLRHSIFYFILPYSA